MRSYVATWAEVFGGYDEGMRVTCLLHVQVDLLISCATTAQPTTTTTTYEPVALLHPPPLC
jgi:hypothetical protein